MTPGRACDSGLYFSHSYGGQGTPYMDDRDLFGGYGTEGRSASVSAFRWGNGADVRQVPVSAGVFSREPARKRALEGGQAAALPAAKKPADRTVQIDGFTWTLPPDPGKGGPYPTLTFLIGAAISSSDSGAMKLAEIVRWVRERYPSKLASTGRTISCMLCREIDFVSTRTDKQTRVGEWTLRNPPVFRSYYEKNIFLRRRPGFVLETTLRNTPSASEQGVASAPSGSLSSDPLACPDTADDTHLAPELPVEIGGYILALPSCSPGQQRDHLRLLCGCAIALGSEQGSGVNEIAEWIADRYFVRDKNAKRKLRYDISRTLSTCRRDFRRTEICAPRRKEGRGGMRWVLDNPADFATSYGSVRAASSTAAAETISVTPVSGDSKASR